MNIEDFIRAELFNYDIKEGSEAYHLILQNAVEAASIFNKDELRTYIKDYIDLLPDSYFY